jgi:hypothetical protein
MPETVTIIDPRHPLYDQTFPLLHIKNKQNLVPACLIRLRTSVERLVPLAVTNLAASTPTTFPVSLDLSSLHNLNQTFRRIHAHLEKECSDDPAENEQSTFRHYHSAAGMGDPERSPTANNSADDRQGLPESGSSMETGGQS